MGELAGVVLRTALDAGYLLAAGVLPPLIAGIVLQFVTSLFGVCCIEVFGIRFCVWVTAPGVMMHEFSHALACLVFRHRIRELVLFSPQKNGTLGWVIHEWDTHSLWQRIGCFFIGVAPLGFGLGAILFLTLQLLPYEALPFPDLPDGGAAGFKEQFRATFLGLCGVWINPGILSGWRFWVWLYAMIAIGSQISLSGADLEGAKSGAAALTLVLVVGAVVLALLFPDGMPLPVAAIRFSATICGLLFYLLLLFGGLALLLMACRAGYRARRRRN